MNTTETELTWHETTLLKSRMATSVGSVPILTFVPAEKGRSGAIVSLHYMTGSKEVWLNDEHAQLLAYAIANSIPFFAFDLYGHGEWESDDPDFNTEDIDGEQWETFVADSTQGIAECITQLCAQHQIDAEALDFVGYSVGNLIGVKLIAAGIAARSFAMGSPVPWRAYDDAYALHNNLEALVDLPLLVLTGKSDEEVEEGEVAWFFERVESDKKELLVFDSGHSLPKVWFEKVTAFIGGVR